MQLNQLKQTTIGVWGSTVLDRIFSPTVSLADLAGDKHEIRNQYTLGGGGANTTEVISRVSKALNIPVEVVLYTMIGPEGFVYNGETHTNNGHGLVHAKLKALGNVTVRDMASRYKLQNNIVVCPMGGDRSVFGDENVIRFNEISKEFKSDILKQVYEEASRMDYLMFQSRMTLFNNVAARGAHANNHEPYIVLDFDAKNAEAAKKLKTTLDRADAILCPRQAVLPDMEGKSFEQLYQKLKTNFLFNEKAHTSLIAVSNSTDPVLACTRADERQLLVNKDVVVVDNNKSGDTRDGLFIIAKILGYDDIDALDVVNKIMDLAVSHHDLDWTEPGILIPYLIEHGIFVNRLPEGHKLPEGFEMAMVA